MFRKILYSLMQLMQLAMMLLNELFARTFQKGHFTEVSFGDQVRGSG